MFLQQASYTPSFGGLGLKERHPDGRGIKEFLRILTLKDQVGRND